MPLPERASPLKMSRRRSLQVGAATAAAGLVTSSKIAPPAQAGNLPPGPATPAFMVELPVYTAKLPVARLTPASTQAASVADGECGRPDHQRRDNWPPQKSYTLDVREGWHSFHPNLPTQKIWGYDGIYPGPTFVARYGEPIIVRIYNNLPRNSVGFGSPEISTHLHNLHCASESDGFAGDYYSAANYGPTLTAAGNYKDHHYPHFYAGYDHFGATNGDPREALGTLWYHDHRDGFTTPNVYKGMTGMYLLFDDIDSGDERDPNPKALRLPSGVGKYDIPLVFQDKQFDSSGYLFLDQFENDGILGNKFCVNGKIQPFFKVERRKYRFRLLDGGPSRFYEFYLTTPDHVVQSFSFIASDGNLLPSPLTMSKVPLAPAERADIVIDFSKYDTGTSLFLVNRLVHTDGKGPDGESVNTRNASGLLTKRGTQILRFDIGNAPALPDVSQVPALLRALPDIDLKQVVKTRRFEFDKTNEVWTVNGQIYDAEKATVKPKMGTAEIWVLEGKGSWHHPVHIHFEEGRILTRNGRQPPPHERGRKDVYVLAPGEVVRVFIRFRDFTGKYMMHCHNTIHEDHAMMIRYDIVE
ncbi:MULTISPECIES: multicopper oxidase family protein [unclassified Polaromonas]|uniref:multicopper oxidase family protein n=1 Tax=unclassified Polaromonas TaxID=2638319 RepID=UPI001A298888|nr:MULTISPECIES: multicopper oxidase domain-containing protein [unclassified Polaromonas]MBG6071823.1 FtsP/CotA-like multicopper oxidase with cupredoxin domain [Polaromonas sp. CG_9.7]MBG6113824.1 FtsP/CotA-like multicopper oxidase with cupredoxin domain [Polaromonas sp. CG_9.2]MDH6183741.1 FtsP/CotA-like multicopper oxidase with cupredoxin domain [Polaromonas sp. CG_23.6]